MSSSYKRTFLRPNEGKERYEQISAELIRALRGRRSRAQLSRIAGYQSNIVHRWETGQCWPTASRLLSLGHALGRRDTPWLERFFRRMPAWAVSLDPNSRTAVSRFLLHLKGNTPIAVLAQEAAFNRSSVSRWLSGKAEPKLPDFLRLVDFSSRRLLDLIAALVDPALLPSCRASWKQLQLARQAAYGMPWSHGVLRALELSDSPRGVTAQQAWIARQLGITVPEVSQALTMLENTAQINKTRSGYKLRESAIAVDTSEEPERARQLKVAWTKTALERQSSGQPGRFGYTLFAISRSDMRRLHRVHLQYVSAMQEIISRSAPCECVGLYCSQLLNLGGEFPETD